MIRDALPADFADIVHINAESEHLLSPLTHQRLGVLQRRSVRQSQLSLVCLAVFEVLVH